MPGFSFTLGDILKTLRPSEVLWLLTQAVVEVRSDLPQGPRGSHTATVMTL